MTVDSGGDFGNLDSIDKLYSLKNLLEKRNSVSFAPSFRRPLHQLEATLRQRQ